MWGASAPGVQRLAETGGGLYVIADRGVQAELPLPVAGLLSDAPLAEVAEGSQACGRAAEALGCSFPAPFQILAFLALSVIPKLKMMDHGLIDVLQFRLTSVMMEVNLEAEPRGGFCLCSEVIKKLLIENLKALSGAHSFELAPITLIFGPNSAGKSTIIQSLLLLKQTLAPYEAGDDIVEPRLIARGDLVDLGTFLTLIHAHDAKRQLRIGLEFDPVRVPRPVPPTVDREARRTVELAFSWDAEVKALTAGRSDRGAASRGWSLPPRRAAPGSNVLLVAGSECGRRECQWR